MRLPILVCCSIVLAAGPGMAAEPTGEWRVANGFANIRIVDCAGALWGVVSWEKTPGRDTENPDPALRSRPTLGIPILLDMKPGRDRWDGHVYNSENGKTYIANIKLLSANTLRIEGCILGGLFCGGEEWTRVAQSNPPPATGAQQKGTKALPKSAAAADDVCSRVSNLPGRPH